MAESKQEVAFRYAVERVNANRKILSQSLLSAIIEKIPPQDSFHASKRGKITCVVHLETPKNRARGNRKTLQRPKTMSKIKFRNLKLKSHEEYLICRTYFVKSKT